MLDPTGLDSTGDDVATHEVADAAEVADVAEVAEVADVAEVAEVADVGHASRGGDEVVIDCATCPVRAIACDDCLVSVLLGPPEFDAAASAALVVLADRGLVPPLRDPRDAASRHAG